MMEVGQGDPISHESRMARFFDVTGGIVGLGLVLAAVILFIALPGYQHKVITIAIATSLLLLGIAAGFGTSLRKTRIAVGVVFLLFVLLSVGGLVLLSRG